jgi:hypothetical protein
VRPEEADGQEKGPRAVGRAAFQQSLRLAGDQPSVCLSSGAGEAYRLKVPPNWPGVSVKMLGSSSNRSMPAGLTAISHESGSSCPEVPTLVGTLEWKSFPTRAAKPP